MLMYHLCVCVCVAVPSTASAKGHNPSVVLLSPHLSDDEIAVWTCMCFVYQTYVRTYVRVYFTTPVHLYM